MSDIKVKVSAYITPEDRVRLVEWAQRHRTTPSQAMAMAMPATLAYLEQIDAGEAQA